jgi:hypothetical protein
MTTQNETEVVARSVCPHMGCVNYEFTGRHCVDEHGCNIPCQAPLDRLVLSRPWAASQAAITALTNLGFSRRADVVEECARVADDAQKTSYPNGDFRYGYNLASDRIAKSIRSPSPQSKDTIPVIRFGDEK